MKKTNRDDQVAREHRALRRKRRSLERSRIITLQQRRHALPRSLAQALAPLREVTLAALGLSSVMGCEPNEPVSPGVEAGIMAGTGAGVESGAEAGVMAGTGAGVESGAEAGIMAGTGAGTNAGIEAGTLAGAVAGETPMIQASIDELCANPTPLMNNLGEPNGYAQCEEGVVIRVGPARCDDDPDAECVTDAECDPDGLSPGQCVCANVEGTNGWSTCVYGSEESCSQGSDCESGYCGVSALEDKDGCFGDFLDLSLGCYTSEDMCVSDQDCDSRETCVLSSFSNLWHCEGVECGVGRPLTEGEACHVAPLERGAGWSRDIPQLDITSLTQRERERVLQSWSAVTQLEHSSVASFARFTLELMSLGAPADLLLATQEAAADEVRHTQRAAEILSALCGEQITLGALALHDVSLSAGRADMITRLLREACFGETLGVAEVTEQARLCTDPVIRAHLDQVREDETRHAGLAWRALRWLLESAPADEQPDLERLIYQTIDELWRSARSEVTLEPIDVASERRLNRFGVLSPRQVQVAHQVAYREVIAPSLAQLKRALASA